MSQVQDYKTLFQHIPLPAIVLDAKSDDFTIIEVNESFQDVFSKPISTALGKAFFDLFPMDKDEPEGKQQLYSFKKVIKTGEPDETGVLKVKANSAHNKFPEAQFYHLRNIPIKNDSDEVELIIHTIQDVTREKLKARQIEESEKRFRALVENGSDVLFVLNKDGSPKYVSPNISYVLGYNVEQAMQFKPYEIIHPLDLPHVMKEIEVALSNPAMPISVTSARMRHKNGSWRWMAGTITNMLHDPAIGGIVDNFRDITEKIEAENRLKESKEKFQSLVQSMDGIFWEADAQTFTFNYVSRQVESILGYTQDEWLREENFWQNRIHPEDRTRAIQYCHHETQEGRNHEFEYRIRKSDGSYIWVRDIVTVSLKNGKPDLLRGFIIDITNKKELQAQLDDIYNLTKIGNWILDLVQHTLTWSEFVKELHGVPQDYQPDLESAINFYEEGESREKISRAVAEAVESGAPFDLELKITTADQNKKWVRVVGKPIFSNNECIALHGSTQDITKRKKTEIAEQKNRQQIDNILYQSMDVICVIDQRGRFEVVSSAAEDVWGYQPEELEGEEYIQYVVPEDRDRTIHTAEQIMSGVDQTNFENRYLHKSGEVVPIVWAARWSDEDQKMYAIARDARELKEAQKKLAETEDQLRNIIEHSTNLFYTHDVEGNLTYVSPQSREFFGYSPEESKRHWSEFVTDHPDNYKVREFTERAIKSGKPQPPYELQLKKSDGTTMWVEVNEAPIVKNGETVAIVGSLTDIDERKKYQEELISSLERYDYVSKASRDAIYDWNIPKNEQHWGAGFGSLLGYDTQKLNISSDSWENLLHPEDKETTMQEMRRTLYKTDENKFTAEYRLQKKNGEYAFVADLGYIIRDKNENPIRMIGAIRDITESKSVEIQKTLQNNLSQFFNKNSKLQDILTDCLEYFADYVHINTSEIWLLSQTKTHLNLISSHANDEKGNRFYEGSSHVKKFLHGEGLPGMVWEQHEHLFWDNIFEPGNYIRFEAAAEAGLRSAYGILLTHNEEFVGVLLMSSDRPLSEQQSTIQHLSSLGDFLGAEIKRRQKEEELQLLFDSAPDILAITAQDGKFIRVNPAFCEITGYSEEELTSVPFQTFIHPDDLTATQKEYKETVTGERNADNYINRWKTKSGEYRWISWSSSDLFGEDNLVFAFGRDVTQTIKLKNLLQQTSDLAKIGSWQIDLKVDQKSHFWSETTRKIMEVDDNYSPSLPENYEFYSSESKNKLKQAIENARQTGESFDLELNLNTAKGNRKWVRCIGNAEFNNNRCIRLFGSFQDITDRVLAKQEILQSEQRFRTLVQDSGDVIGILDKNAVFKYITPNTESILNIPSEEFIGKSVTEFIHPNDLPYIEEIIYSIYLGERYELKPFRFQDGKGNWRWIETVITNSMDNPGVNGFVINSRDVTRQQHREQKLEELSLVAAKTTEIVIITDALERITWVNSAFEDLTEYSLDEVIGKKPGDFLQGPETAKKARNTMREAIDKYESVSTVVLNYSKSGQAYWLEINIDPIFDDKGNCTHFIAIERDVTEKIKREIELRESIERYEIVAKATSDTIWDMNLSTGLVQYNKNIYEMFGYEKDQVYPAFEWWKENLHPDDRPIVNQKLREVLANGTERFQLEYRFKASDGSYKFVFDRAFVLKDEKGEPVRIIGAMQDITQETIEQQELKLRESVITNTNDTVVITESEPKDGEKWRQIIYVNPAFERITGYSKEEVLGESIEILNGPKTDNKEIQKIRDSVENMESCDAEILNYTKDGKTFWNNFSLAPVKDKFGNFTHWIIIGRDVSDYKENEKELKDSIKEKETLLAEIHHRVKNNLAIVSSLMQMQAMSSESEELNRQLMESVLRIKSMAGIHEQLYQAQNFSKLQFSDSLKSLTENIVDTLQTETDVELKLDLETIELNINQSVPCSLIMNEIITNILKHAFTDREKGTIQLTTQLENDLITINVTDDGMGLPKNFQEIKSSSLGLELIEVLTKQLNGESRYISNGNGTTFELKFKRADVKGAGSGFMI